MVDDMNSKLRRLRRMRDRSKRGISDIRIRDYDENDRIRTIYDMDDTQSRLDEQLASTMVMRNYYPTTIDAKDIDSIGGVYIP